MPSLSRDGWMVNINSLWPSDVKMWHRSQSSLAQEMACCLMAPSHYMKKCWLIISEDMWYLPEGMFIGNAHDINHQTILKNYTFKITATCLKVLRMTIDASVEQCLQFLISLGEHKPPVMHLVTLFTVLSVQHKIMSHVAEYMLFHLCRHTTCQMNVNSSGKLHVRRFTT